MPVCKMKPHTPVPYNAPTALPHVKISPTFLFDCPRYEHLRHRCPELFAQASRSPAVFLSSTDCSHLAEYIYSCYQIYKALSTDPHA